MLLVRNLVALQGLSVAMLKDMVFEAGVKCHSDGFQLPMAHFEGSGCWRKYGGKVHRRFNLLGVAKVRTDPGGTCTAGNYVTNNHLWISLQACPTAKVRK